MSGQKGNVCNGMATKTNCDILLIALSFYLLHS